MKNKHEFRTSVRYLIPNTKRVLEHNKRRVELQEKLSRAKETKTNPDVGANKAPPTKEEIVQSIVKAAAYANVDLLDIAEALMEIDTVAAADAEAAVAAVAQYQEEKVAA